MSHQITESSELKTKLNNKPKREYDEFEYISEYARRNKDFYVELFGSWDKIQAGGDDDYDQRVIVYNPKIPMTSPFYEHTRWNDPLDRIEFNGSCWWNRGDKKKFSIYSNLKQRGSWETNIESIKIKSPYTAICTLAEDLYSNGYVRPMGFELNSNLQSPKYLHTGWKYFQDSDRNDSHNNHNEYKLEVWQ